MSHILTKRTATNQGIALGPILFIIAILAVLAAVISAGSGAFNANTKTESAKAMAQVIVAMCDDFQRAQQKMVMENGCDETKLDFSPPGYPPGATWVQGNFTGTTGTSRSGNGQCAFFDVRGGGVLFKQIPSAALDTTLTGAFLSANDGGVNEDAYAGYPLFLTAYCINNLGVCSSSAASTSNASILMIINYVNYSTCKEINNILQFNHDPNTLNIGGIAAGGLYGAFNNSNVWTNGGPYSNISVQTVSGYNGVGEVCAHAGSPSLTTYAFMCPVMIR